MRRPVALATTILGLLLGWFALLSPVAVQAKDACVCKCIPSFSNTAQWSNLTAGNTTCKADCAEVCGGTSNLQDPETGGRKVTVSCLPDSNDCDKGAYSVYEDVACVLQYDTADPNAQTTWPETSGKKPVCVVPLTPKNANIECQSYGGVAKGGTCGKIENGTDPNAYFKSRPKLGAIGTDFTGSYSFAQWDTMLENLRPGNRIDAGDGICYQYGAKYGGAPTYDGFDPGSNGENVSGATPTNDYVCIKAKQNTCGTVKPPTGKYGELPARAYSCQRPADVRIPAGQSLDSVCFPTGGDTCAASAGTRCCQGGGSTIGECLLNSECSVDGSRICSNGKCVINDVCDPFHNQAIPAGSERTPWQFDQRRCRNANPTEKANPDICSGEVGTFRCANTSQSCCRAANPAVISGCASDFVLKAGSSSVFNDFSCVPPGEIPESQYVTVGGNRTLAGFDKTATDWNQYNAAGPARHCLTTTIPKYDAQGRLTGSVSRCGGGSTLCCNAPRLVQLGGAQSFGAVQRAAIGATCGPGGNYVCRSFNEMLPPNNEAAKQRGFITPAAYLVELGKQQGCQLTPFDPNLPTAANKECVSGGVCCDRDMPAFNALPCVADTDCTATGLVCNKTLGICVNEDLVAPSTPGTSCLTQARTDIGANAVTQLTNVNAGVAEGEYQCQRIVSDSTSVAGKCLPPGAGCGANNQGGQEVRCCVPGVGLPVSSAAQQSVSVPPQAPYSLWLPACIKSGSCTLDDIVATGAAFANLLLQIVGSVFLTIFVYGGFKYLTAGSSSRAQDARKMLITAAKAMALIMAAYVFVHFIESSLVGGKNPGQSQTCLELSTAETSYACQFLVAPASDSRAISEEISRRSCQRNRCPGPANYVCCPQ